MKKMILSISLFTALAMSLPAQVTREQADTIVLEYLQNEVTTPYTLYVNVNLPSEEGIAITTSNEETCKAKYACWAYYLNESEAVRCRYLFVKENDGNLLEVIAHNDSGLDDLSSWELLSPVGLIDRERENVLVYPNPTTGQLRIDNGEWKIDNVEIYDVMGRKQTIIINCQLSIINSIDISHLPAGIYFIKLQTQTETITKKVIKN